MARTLLRRAALLTLPGLVFIAAVHETVKPLRGMEARPSKRLKTGRDKEVLKVGKKDCLREMIFLSVPLLDSWIPLA